LKIDRPLKNGHENNAKSSITICVDQYNVGWTW